MATATETEPRTAPPEGGRYAADRNPDGTWNLRDVPIFVARGRYTEEWCRAAVAKDAVRRTENHAAPLHVNHHEFTGNPSEAIAVQEAGLLALKRVDQIVYEGEKLPAVFADFLAVPPKVYQRIKARRLRYRSVEILNPNRPEISSCALLSHDVPALKLPMLTVGEEVYAEGANHDSERVTFRASPEEVFMDENEKKAEGEKPPEKKAEAPALDVKALATELVAALVPALKAALAEEESGESEDPPAGDPEAPAEAYKEAFARIKDAEARAAGAEKAVALFKAERQADASVTAARRRLEKAGVEVDAAYEDELRGFAAKGADVLEAVVVTRERFREEPAKEPPVWGGPDRAPRRVGGKLPAEVEAYKGGDPDVFERAKAEAVSFAEIPVNLREGISLKRALELELGPPPAKA